MPAVLDQLSDDVAVASADGADELHLHLIDAR